MPFIAIDQTEATQLGNASADLMEIYGVPELAPETIAWSNLIQAVAFIYGSRVIAYRAMVRRAEAEKRKPPTAENSRGSTTPAPNAPQPPSQQMPEPQFKKQYIEGLGEIDVPLQA